MLARLADLAPDAATDHSGALLRLVHHAQLDTVRARLAQLGYASEELTGSERETALGSAWFSPADLSREEARVLASRIVPAFIREHPIDSTAAETLQERVESALFGCFTLIALPSDAPSGALRAGCANAVSTATNELLGEAASRALGTFVERWLART